MLVGPDVKFYYVFLPRYNNGNKNNSFNRLDI